MTTDYRLDLYDDAGDLDAVITDFSDLSYTKIVNHAGLMQFQLRGDHPVLERIQDKWFAYVYRRPAGYYWACDFVGILQNEEWNYDEKPVYVATCPGLLSMLRWRHNLYYSNQNNLTKFNAVPAETILKRLVDYNCAVNATVVNGRMRDGAIPGVVIEADLGRGNVLDSYCAWKNIVEIMEEIAPVAGGDYEMITNSSGAYEFRFYPGQLGTDRRGTVIFSLERGNMGNPAYTHKHSDEKTVALVGGQGEMLSRQTGLAYGANYGVSNDIELFVDARDIETGKAQALIDRGLEKLAEVQSRETFMFDVLQTQSSKYGVDYFLGDLVTSLNPFNQQTYDQKIEAVTIGFDSDGKEGIRVGMRTP